MRARQSLGLLAFSLAVAAAVACGSAKSSGYSPGDDRGPGRGDGGPSLGDGGDNRLGEGGVAQVTGHATFGCDGCPPFPAGGAPSCAAGTLGVSQVAYPKDDVLFPPNLNLLEVHFPEVPTATLYEVAFTNGATEIRVATRCTRVDNGRHGASAGCTLALPLQAFRDVAETNRDGDPVKVTVRATVDGACVTESPPIAIRFAKEDVKGGIYYWQSAVFGNNAGTTGGIYTHDFGSTDPKPAPFYTSGATGTCVGCHNLSRDGERISLGTDDPDDDDGFDDVSTSVLDTKSRTVLATGLVPGFQTWAHDHSRVVTSSWQDFNPLAPNAGDDRFNFLDGQGGANVGSPTIPGGIRGTQPDLSPDDTLLAFVAPKTFASALTVSGDHHFHGGTLYVSPVGVGAGTLGAPKALATPTGDGAFYYPSFSPDGRFLAVNHTAGGDVFYNKNARVQLLRAAGGAPIDLARLNQADGLSNSWPRWSPLVQTYKGRKIAWVTFSSSRDYGLRLHNQGLPHCYPSECPDEDKPQLGTGISSLDGCESPQIWMAAVDVEDGEPVGGDRSSPAFWMPFQDISSHNHSAQWVDKVVSTPQVTCGSKTCSADTLCCAPDNCQPVCVR